MLCADQRNELVPYHLELIAVHLDEVACHAFVVAAKVMFVLQAMKTYHTHTLIRLHSLFHTYSTVCRFVCVPYFLNGFFKHTLDTCIIISHPRREFFEPLKMINISVRLQVHTTLTRRSNPPCNRSIGSCLTPPVLDGGLYTRISARLVGLECNITFHI